MSQDSCEDNDETSETEPSIIVKKSESPMGHEYSGQQSNGPRPPWYKSTNIWVAIFTGILTIATILQWQTTITNHKITERAWVTIKGITLQAPMVAGQEAFVVAGFYNSGHSPALQLTAKHKVAIASSFPNEDRSNFKHIQAGSLSVMGPDSKMLNQPDGHLVNAEDMSNLVAGKVHLYSWGIIEYTDIFGTNHWTTFCYRSRNLTELNLVACSEWNEVDKN